MTPDDIDRRLPRVATWPPKLYDLTDAAERAEAVAWLYGLLSDEQGSVGTVGTDEAETGVPGDFLKQMHDRAYDHRGQSIPMTEREVEWLAEACDQNPISAVHRARGGELRFLGRLVELKEHA